MKVGPWQEDRSSGRIRLSIRVQWEDRARDDVTIWFEWPEARAAAVNNTPLTAIGDAMRTHLGGLAIASTAFGIDTGIQQQPVVDPLFATRDFDVHPVHQMVTRAEKVRRGGRHDGATVGNGGRSHRLRRDGSAQPA